MSIISVVERYKPLIEESLRGCCARFGADALSQACTYALMGAGKRLRPAITLIVASSLNKKGYDASLSGVAVECLHAASLVADDLPCMDDDDERRNRPSVHKAFGEGVALLASYALISCGYESIYRNGELLKSQKNDSKDADQRTVLALECLARNTGARGAVGGQFLDVFLRNPTELQVRAIIHGKTGTLFEISFVLGWLFGGGELSKLEEVKAMARHFGLAFQITDDFDDLSQDFRRDGSVNYAQVAGAQEALKVLNSELDLFEAIASSLNVNGAELLQLSEGLRMLAGQRASSAAMLRGNALTKL